jgi:hypothetical protein
MPRSAIELEDGAEPELVEQFYAEIQQERRNAAAEGRVPDVERVMTHRAHEEEVKEEVEDEPPSTPARDEPERNSPVPEAPRSEVAASRPAPQPQLRKPEPPVAERVDRIWNDYVEAKRRGEPLRRPGPRIRSL